MSKALKNINNHQTAQTVKASPVQVENNAGGFVFSVTDKSRLERFLILGTDGGTYYVDEKKLTEANVEFVKNLITKDEALVRNTMVDIADNNRAVRVSPTIFTAALLHTYGADKEALRAVLPKILRTSTHLFEYAEYVKNLGGWGRSKRNAVKDWYEGKTEDQLALQLVKYRQRNGWTHRDLLRISHAKPEGVLAQFALGKELEGEAPDIIKGYLAVSKAKNVKEVLAVLKSYPSLPWEAIPTEFHKDAEIWKTLFRNGSLKGTALLRNVTRLAKLDAFTDLDFASDYAKELADVDAVKRSRLHPINYLNASVVYADGQLDRNGYSMRRNKSWTTESMIADALDAGFYTAFGNITPANKRNLVALDVSGSMASPAAGLELSCAQVAASMAMVLIRTEPKALIRGFTSNGYNWSGAELTDLGVTKTDNLPQVMKKVHNLNFGATDCSLPMEWARENKVAIDTFSVITDNETYAGRIHPFQSLKKYRKEMGIDARLAVFGVSATDFTIADPSDPGMMDFVGFDTSAPNVFTDFSAGRL